jgi:hypothetical protein
MEALDVFYWFITAVMLFFVGNSAVAFRNQWHINRQTGGKLRAVQDRMLASGTKTIALSMFSSLGFNRILGWDFGMPFVLFVLAAGMLIVGLPSLYWNYLYYTNRFGETQSDDGRS